MPDTATHSAPEKVKKKKNHIPVHQFWKRQTQLLILETKTDFVLHSNLLQPTHTSLQEGEDTNPARLFQRHRAGEEQNRKGGCTPQGLAPNRRVPSNQILTQNILHQHIPGTNPRDRAENKEGKNKT